MHENVRQGGTFIAVGLAATLTHAAAALLAAQIVGLAPLTANLIGYCSAVGLSYTANARLTFRRSARDVGQFARFLTISLGMLALNQGLVFLLVERAHWPFWAALIPVVPLIPAVSFSLSKLWAFRRLA